MLTERGIKAGKDGEKLMDTNGLYLDISPKGVKTWRVRYKRNGKETRKSIGRYPQMTLKEARDARDVLLGYAAAPVAQSVEVRFGDIAREWWAVKQKSIESDKNLVTMGGRMERYILPVFDGRSIDSFKPRDLLERVKEIETQGTVETAHRVYGMFKQIFTYAFAHGYIESIPIVELKGLISPVKPKHHASLVSVKDIKGLWLSMDGYCGSYQTKYALFFSAYTFQRPGEIRRAEWSEFDFDNAEWRIPKEKMKMKRPHVVPLASQVIGLLLKLKEFPNNGPFVFPSDRSYSRPMSENTVNGALRRLGYSKEEMTAHGFRSMASTRLNESGLWSRDAIELQLAHVEGNNVRAAYNYAEKLEERREMMQWWADWLDGVRGS